MSRIWQREEVPEASLNLLRNCRRKTLWRRNLCLLARSATPSKFPWTKIPFSLILLRLQFLPNHNWKGLYHSRPLSSLRSITLWILNTSNKCLSLRWQGQAVEDHNLWCLTSTHRITLLNPSLSPSQMLDHSWDNLKYNSSNLSSNNSNFHFNNLSNLTNLWTHLLRLILSSSKCNNSSNTNKTSLLILART